MFAVKRPDIWRCLLKVFGTYRVSRRCRSVVSDRMLWQKAVGKAIFMLLLYLQTLFPRKVLLSSTFIFKIL